MNKENKEKKGKKKGKKKIREITSLNEGKLTERTPKEKFVDSRVFTALFRLVAFLRGKKRNKKREGGQKRQRKKREGGNKEKKETERRGNEQSDE